jgi:predicted lipoprotein
MWTVAVIACALALLVPLVHGALADAETDSVEETVTVDYDTNTTLNQTGSSYELTVTVDGTELDNGTDYVFDPGAASIDWQNTTASSGGDTATLSYDVVDRTQTTDRTVDILATTGSWAGFLLMIAALGYLVTLIGGGGF